MSKPGAYGVCSLCNKRVAKSAMKRHLDTCLEASVEEGKDASELVLLRVESRDKIYWLYLGVKPNVKLQEIDQALQDVWLACCGHLSEFFRGEMSEELKMGSTIQSVLKADDRPFEYIYDFGSSTELIITPLGRYKAAPSRQKLRFLARNEAPNWGCGVCGEPATDFCTECFYDEDPGPLLCAEHAKAHEQEDEDHEGMLLPVVNSPRMGVCAYIGPVQME